MVRLSEVAIMMGGNEILDKIVHLMTHTTRIKADTTVKNFFGLLHMICNIQILEKNV